MGGGIGSILSNKFKMDPSRLIKFVSLTICILVVIYAITLPYIFELFIGESVIQRQLIAGLIIFPLAFVMGIPFPTGIKILKQTLNENHIPWMWGINGTTSVFGSSLAIIIAIQIGFTYALIAGAIAYFIIFLTFHRFTEKLIS
jgi:hypothetical protein